MNGSLVNENERHFFFYKKGGNTFLTHQVGIMKHREHIQLLLAHMELLQMQQNLQVLVVNFKDFKMPE